MAKHIFIGGLHRSGTSLVHRLLRAHPGVAGFERTGVPEDEGQHLQDTLPTARSLGGPGRFGFRRGAHLTEHSPLAVPATRDALLAAWGPLWTGAAEHRVEKSPPNLLRFRLLQALFPEAVFVAVVRHPLAVALATQRMRRLYRLRSVRSLLEHWLACQERFELDRPHLRRLHVVRYEELVADPAAAWSALLESCGLEYAPLGEEVQDGADARHARRWARLRRLPWVAGPVMSRERRVAGHGYSLGGFGSY